MIWWCGSEDPGQKCRWAPEILKSSILMKMTKNDVFEKSDCFWLFALFDFLTKFANRGGILEELNAFFRVFWKKCLFWSFLQKSTNSTKCVFLAFLTFLRKVTFFDDFRGPRRSGAFFSDFRVFRGGEPRFSDDLDVPGVRNHRIWTIWGSWKSVEIVEKVTFLTFKKWRFCHFWHFWRFWRFLAFRAKKVPLLPLTRDGFS